MTPRTLTWINAAGVAWRLELIDRRWVLPRWLPITEQWLHIGDYPTRTDAISAAYDDQP